MTGLHLPDVSEWQGTVNWPAVVRQNGGAAIIRALYGTSYVDKQWPANRVNAHKAGIKVLGIYQYVRANEDVNAQAEAFVKLVGSLQPGEFAVLDLEEGSGDQDARAQAWLSYVDAHLTYPGYHGAWLYSGLLFAENDGLTPIFYSARHTWVADYTTIEPGAEPHSLWQHSDGIYDKCSSEPWAGIGYCDCNQFDGTLAELEARVWDVPPPEPAFPLPAAFSNVPRTVTVEIAWSPVAGATKYQYQATDLTTGKVIVADNFVTSPSALLTVPVGGEYQWRMAVPEDATHLPSPWSPWRKFTT